MSGSFSPCTFAQSPSLGPFCVSSTIHLSIHCISSVSGKEQKVMWFERYWSLAFFFLVCHQYQAWLLCLRVTAQALHSGDQVAGSGAVFPGGIRWEILGFLYLQQPIILLPSETINSTGHVPSLPNNPFSQASCPYSFFILVQLLLFN